MLPNLAQRVSGRERYRLPFRIALVAFLGIAGFFLWTEHQAHLFGALPYALLLACVAIHLLMHGTHGHGHGGAGTPGAGDRNSREKRGLGGE